MSSLKKYMEKNKLITLLGSSCVNSQNIEGQRNVANMAEEHLSAFRQSQRKPSDRCVCLEKSFCHVNRAIKLPKEKLGDGGACL